MANSTDALGSGHKRNVANMLYLHANDGSSLFAQDATFCPQAGRNGQGDSVPLGELPDRDLRHYNSLVYIATNGGTNTYDSATSWTDDVSWVAGGTWTPDPPQRAEPSAPPAAPRVIAIGTRLPTTRVFGHPSLTVGRLV